MHAHTVWCKTLRNYCGIVIKNWYYLRHCKIKETSINYLMSGICIKKRSAVEENTNSKL